MKAIVSGNGYLCCERMTNDGFLIHESNDNEDILLVDTGIDKENLPQFQKPCVVKIYSDGDVLLIEHNFE